MHDGPVSTPTNLQVAFIGCGAVSRFHADVLGALGASICAVCGRPGSSNAREFADRYNVPRVYDSWRRLLDQERPDAIWVVASWTQIDALLVPIIECGIPCLVEKPAALSASRLREAIAARERSGSSVRVGYNRRFYDFVPRMKAILSSETLRAIEVHIPEAMPEADQYRDGMLSRYMWLMKSSHILDLLCYLVGRPIVTSIVRGHDHTLGIPTSFNGLLRTQQGVPMHLAANWSAPDRYSLTFYYGDTMLRVSPLERMRIFRGLRREPLAPGRPIHTFEPSLVEEQVVDMTYKPGFLAQARSFLDACVMKRVPDTPGCTLEDALSVTELCDEIGGSHE